MQKTLVYVLAAAGVSAVLYHLGIFADIRVFAEYNPNVFVFGAGVLIAFIFTFAWKVLGGLRALITGKDDVIRDEVRVFDYRRELTLARGIFFFLTALSVAAAAFDAGSAALGIQPLFFPLGLALWFPLLKRKKYSIERIRRERNHRS
ncbi:MAG: hypothetical protein HYS74_00215 [Parcubacteria group bacterium]|nr:hypothetical protein [Parcubacteria group bacterium]